MALPFITTHAGPVSEGVCLAVPEDSSRYWTVSRIVVSIIGGTTTGNITIKTNGGTKLLPQFAISPNSFIFIDDLVGSCGNGASVVVDYTGDGSLEMGLWAYLS